MPQQYGCCTYLAGKSSKKNTHRSGKFKLMGRHNLGRSFTTFVAPAFSSPVFQQTKKQQRHGWSMLVSWMINIRSKFPSAIYHDKSLPSLKLTWAPENNPLEKEIPIVFPSFLGVMLVSGSAHILYIQRLNHQGISTEIDSSTSAVPKQKKPPVVKSPRNAAEPTAIARPCLKARPWKHHFSHRSQEEIPFQALEMVD